MSKTGPLPRKGSLMYSVKHPEYERKALSRFKFFNKWFVVPLYRANILPTFGFGKLFVLIKTKGRKSGRTYYVPLEYRKKDGKILLFASRGKKSDWLKNILANPGAFEIKIGFKGFRKPKKIELIDDFERKFEILKYYVERYPGAAKELFGWDKKKDTPDIETLKPIVELIEILSLEL